MLSQNSSLYNWIRGAGEEDREGANKRIGGRERSEEQKE